MPWSAWEVREGTCKQNHQLGQVGYACRCFPCWDGTAASSGRLSQLNPQKLPVRLLSRRLTALAACTALYVCLYIRWAPSMHTARIPQSPLSAVERQPCLPGPTERLPSAVMFRRLHTAVRRSTVNPAGVRVALTKDGPHGRHFRDLSSSTYPIIAPNNPRYGQSMIGQPGYLVSGSGNVHLGTLPRCVCGGRRVRD